MTNQEKLTLFENIMARVGIGQALQEYSKAISNLNGFQTFQEMNPPMPPTGQNNAITGQMSSEPTLPPPTDQSGLNQV